MKRLPLLAALCLLEALASAHAQVRPVWTNRYDNALPAKTNTPLGVALDLNGNILVAGSSMNTNNDWDYVVLKYAANGTSLWTNRYDSSSNDLLRNFALDTAGNALLTGTSETVKFGANGAVVWHAPYRGRAVATDTNGNAYVTGFSEVDFATARLDATTGTNVWTKLHDKIGHVEISSTINLDDAGSVYVAGLEEQLCFSNPAACFAGLGAVKYDANGQQQWAQSFYQGPYAFPGSQVKGTALDQNRRLLYVAANINNGKSFVTGQLTLGGQVNWTTYQWGGTLEGVRAFVLDQNGNAYLAGSRWQYYPEYAPFTTYKLGPNSSTNESPVWASDYGPNPGYSRANAIAVDSANNVYITGLSPGPTSGNDFVTISYDPNGSQRWIERWSSAGNFSDEATGIAVDAGGNVYVTGYSTTPQGGSEIVTLKYAPLSAPAPPPVQIKSNGSALLQLPRPAGQPYSVESSTNLLSWQSLGTATTDVTGLFTFEDTNAPSYSTRFYRTVPP